MLLEVRANLFSIFSTSPLPAPSLLAQTRTGKRGTAASRDTCSHYYFYMQPDTKVFGLREHGGKTWGLRSISQRMVSRRWLPFMAGRRRNRPFTPELYPLSYLMLTFEPSQFIIVKQLCLTKQLWRSPESSKRSQFLRCERMYHNSKEFTRGLYSYVCLTQQAVIRVCVNASFETSCCKDAGWHEYFIQCFSWSHWRSTW